MTSATMGVIAAAVAGLVRPAFALPLPALFGMAYGHSIHALFRSGLGLDSRLEDKKTLPQLVKIVFSQSTGAATDHATATLNQGAA